MRYPPSKVNTPKRRQAETTVNLTGHRSFAWAAGLSTLPTTLDGFRQHLILFSMQDQGQDSRDALLTLQHLCREAAAASVDIAVVLREVAAMSSSVDRFGMGSTRDMLMKHCPPR